MLDIEGLGRRDERLYVLGHISIAIGLMWQQINTNEMSPTKYWTLGWLGLPRM